MGTMAASLTGGMDSLREAIESLPIPASPSRLSRSGAVAGLSFLDAALNLRHVRRLTERITLSNHSAPTMTREVDVSLRMLDVERRHPASVNRHTSEDAPERQKTLWVPVDRMSVGNVVPIDVVNAMGERVPRLTQFETSRVLASGLYRLLRSTLTSHPDAADPESDLHRLLYRLDESRLLIQHALVRLLTERGRPSDNVDRVSTAGTVEGHGHQVRSLALEVLDRYIADTSPYAELLKFAVNNYLVVVELDNSKDEHLLSFESPLYVRHQPAGSQLWRRLRASRTGYHMRYVTHIQPTLNSYHLVVEAGVGLQVSTMYLSTDADDDVTRSTTRDLRWIAKEIGNRRGSSGRPHRKILELETQIALRRLSELLRRRRWEASHSGIELRDDQTPMCSALVHAIVAGEAVPGRTGNEKVQNSILRHPSVSPESLSGAAGELQQLEIMRDLSLEAGKPASSAHAYWRRPTGTRPAPNLTRVEARALITDTSGSGVRSVQLYALTVAVIAYLIGWFATGDMLPYFGSASEFKSSSNADAVVTVLLLFPGFLYSRLPLPNPHEVSGYLQVLPRSVAHVCIFVVAALAAAVATGVHGNAVRVLLMVATALPLLGVALLQPVARNSDWSTNLAVLGGPRWLTGPNTARKTRTSFDVDVRSLENTE